MHSFSFSRASPRAVLSLLIANAAVLCADPLVDPAGSSPPQQLAPVVVRGRDTGLIGTASSASQGIVGALELDARPFLRRGELLEVIPGVVVTQHSGDGKANQYFLRGFNLDHGTDLSIAVDGMPVNMRSHAHGQGYADLNFLIPELVRQVDFNKGPFFVDVGDFSAAGATEFRQFDTLPRNFTSFTVGENRYVRFAAGGSRHDGTAATTGAVEFTHDDGPWKLSEDADRFNGFARRHWTNAGGDYQLTAMAYHAKWRSTDQIPRRAVEAGALDRFGNVDSSDGGESDCASVSFDATRKDTDTTLRLNAYAIYYRLNLFSNFTYLLDDPVNGDQFNQRDRRVVVGGALARTWTANRPRVASVTTVGVQTRADFIGELGLHHTAQRVRISTTRDDEVDELSLGVFLKNETRWSDWLRTSAGLRGDGYAYTSRLRGEPATGVNDLHFHPAEPRTFRLTVMRRF